MPKNRVQWSEQEEMLAGAYANIASSFSQITSYGFDSLFYSFNQRAEVIPFVVLPSFSFSPMEK